MSRRWLVALALCMTVDASAKRPPPRPAPEGQTLVENLAKIEGDRLHEFAATLGNVADFPGTAPSHSAVRAAFEKELAKHLGVPSVQLDVVVNPMVGDDKDPPVKTITLQLSDAQLQDALDAIKDRRGAKPQQTAEGSVWTLGRVAVNETRKTVSWGWSRPPLPRAEWDAASLESTRKAVLSIVRDPSDATLLKFVEDLKKRATHRNSVFWDDARATYSFNVTDSNRFIDLSFEKPFPAGVLLKDLGITEVTFTNPCDADFLELLDASGEPLKAGKWSLTLRTTYSHDFEGAVQYCTSHDKVKAVPAAKVTLSNISLSWAGK